ncbi:GNAT family N-acetyltransferase [Lacticaseibacillus suihuaensis]
MTEAAVALWQHRAACAYISDTVAAVAADLADPSVTVVQNADCLAVLDQYQEGPDWVAECWGPFAQDLDAALVVLEKRLLHRPARLRFFAAADSAVAGWLRRRVALRGQTIWSMPRLVIQPPVMPLTTPPADMAAVLALHHQFFAGSAIADVDATHPLFVVRRGQTVAGYAYAEREAQVGRLLYVAVAPAFRRQGLAARLVRSVQADLTGGGATTLTLVQSERAQAAGSLYGRLGFRPVRRLVSGELTVQ